jgi:uncharacterized protein YndB with AHSA1/START domain
MGLLRRVAGVLLLVLVGFAAATVLLPRELSVSRAVVIEAPAERIFPYLNAHQTVTAWSPWTGLDPATETEYAGPSQGVGNRVRWSSDDRRIGAGTMRITVSEPNRRVESALEFDGFGAATTWQDLEPVTGGTRVTWGLVAELGGGPVARARGLLLRRSLGAAFDRGLAQLKATVEAD